MHAPWPDELPRGFEFDRYTVLDCVWRGSVSSVYRAESAAGVVALKVFDRQKGDERRDLRGLSKQARAAALVRHPNVAAVQSAGVWQDRPYVVSQWLEGCDLEDYLDRWGAMSEDEVAELGLHLVAGLIALHGAGASHGDIKPSSVFLCNGTDGDVIPKLLLTDLPRHDGPSSPVDSTTREIALSTPAYLSPEAMRGRGNGAASDQYSVAAVLYECAVGRPPFTGETLLELLQSIAGGKIVPVRELRPELSESLEATLLRALSPEPAERFATLRDLGRALWPLVSERAKVPWAGAFAGGPAGPEGRRPLELGLPRDEASPEGGGRAKKPSLLVLLAASIALSLGLGAFWFYALRSGGGRAHPVPSGASSSASELPLRF